MRLLSDIRLGAPALLAAGALLIAPAAGEAAIQTYGSDLTAPVSTKPESHQADTAFWQTTLSNGSLPTAPAGGQIREVRIKGIAPRSLRPAVQGQHPLAGSSLFHFQVLTHAGESVSAFSASQGFEVPTSGDPNQITTFRPENMCIAQGDSYAFNTIGGWDGIANRDPANGPVGPYPEGTPMQIFADVPGATTKWFEADGKWANPATSSTPFGASHTLENRELLMQMDIGTGPDAFYMCPGGTNNPYRPADPPRVPRPPKPPKPAAAPAPAPVQKVTLPRGQRVNVKRSGVASMALHCSEGPKACAGKVTVYGTTGRLKRAVATKRFSIPAKSTAGVRVKLSKAAHSHYKKRSERLPVRIVAVTEPHGHSDAFRVTLRKVGTR